MIGPVTAATGPDHLAGTADRRGDVRRAGGNGLDAVEVIDDRHLALTFLAAAPRGVRPANVRVETPYGVLLPVRYLERRADEDSELESVLVVELAAPGGRGPHRLALVEASPRGFPGWAPLRGLDPLYTSAVFRFDVNLPAPPGAAGAAPATGDGLHTPGLNYLARDFAGLRQVLLDRLATISPGSVDDHLPDVGMMLVELFAYAGDDLAYYQDAVTTEAYLRTARQRISVRRHARLVGYRLGEGCAARAWAVLEAAAPVSLPLPLVRLRCSAHPATVFTPLLPAALRRPTASGDEPGARLALRPAHNEIALWHWGHHTCRLPAGATAATLVDSSAGAEPAGDDGRVLDLCPGDLLALEEVRDEFGGPARDDHRHVVRLTSVTPLVDPLYGVPLLDVTWGAQDALPMTLPVRVEIADGELVVCAVARGNITAVEHGLPVRRWLPRADVLPDPGVAATTPFPDPAVVARRQATVLRRVEQVWRQRVEQWWLAARHGEALSAERLTLLRRQLGEQAANTLGLTADADAERQAYGLHRLLLDAGRLLAARWRRVAVLARVAEASGPLGTTVVAELVEDWGADLGAALDPDAPAAWGTAAELAAVGPDLAVPAVELVAAAPPDDEPAPRWTGVADLLDGDLALDLSGYADGAVLVEIDDDGVGRLRFRPDDVPADAVIARYALGGGEAGNVATGAVDSIEAAAPAPDDELTDTERTLLAETAAALGAVGAVRNLLPAAGGRDPEPIAAAKRAVPRSYLVDQPRALVADDYARFAAAVPGVAHAAAMPRLTGHGTAIEVVVQPSGGGAPDRYLIDRVRRHLDQVRRIGHDLWLHGPNYREAFLALTVQLAPDVVRADLRTDLLGLLGAGYGPDGAPALFHSERLGFGQPVAASAVVAAVRGVAGVVSVVVTRFELLERPVDLNAVPPGTVPEWLRVGPLEIIRLDGDPVNPQNGYADLTVEGGR